MAQCTSHPILHAMSVHWLGGGGPISPKNGNSLRVAPPRAGLLGAKHRIITLHYISL